MRLWNLITGKRGGVLTFDRRTLQALGEGRYRRGEARSVLWSHDGEQFAVGFERGVLIYGLDCTIRGMIKVEGTKICRLRYVQLSKEEEDGTDRSKDEAGEAPTYVLALSTEDGRILFYYTSADTGKLVSATDDDAMNGKDQDSKIHIYKITAHLGEIQLGMRIKDFALLPTSDGQKQLVVTGASDGKIKIWDVDNPELSDAGTAETHKKQKLNGTSVVGETAAASAVQASSIGNLLGSFETHNRITCLEAFILDPPTVPENTQATDSAVSGVDEDGEEDDFAGFDDG